MKVVAKTTLYKYQASNPLEILFVADLAGLMPMWLGGSKHYMHDGGGRYWQTSEYFSPARREHIVYCCK